MAGVSTGLNEVVAAAASSIEDTACTPTTTAAITVSETTWYVESVRLCMCY